METRFGITVGKLDWLEESNLWLLNGMDGESLGHFDSVVVSDKSVFSSRHTGLTGRLPPLGLFLGPQFWLMFLNFCSNIILKYYVCSFFHI